MVERPEVLEGKTYKRKTPCGTAYITLCGNDSVKEVFAVLGKSGTCERAMLEAISRLLSKGLEYNIPAEELRLTISGINCGEAFVGSRSCVHQLADVMKKYIEPVKEEGNAEEENAK